MHNNSTLSTPIFFRYVDDLITAVPYNAIDTIKNTFNSYNHKIQFTVEEESLKQICFLDVLVIREGNNIKTNWYNKSTSSGQLLNFNSHHPLNYKINVINNLVDKGITLAHKTFHTENINKIKTTLIKNNYPIDFINHVIKKRLKHLSRKAAVLNTHTHRPPEGYTPTPSPHPLLHYDFPAVFKNITQFKSTYVTDSSGDKYVSLQ